ncbi:HTH_48 domain-containing protein [Trichonephila clavipes]|nr:HTH_48 domain-containing protein [Trichonephila clavipes]
MWKSFLFQGTFRVSNFTKIYEVSGSVVFDLLKQVLLVCSEMSDNNFEQRCAIKFCFRLGHNATETFTKLQQAYGDSVLSRAQVFRWFKAFSERRELTSQRMALSFKNR